MTETEIQPLAIDAGNDNDDDDTPMDEKVIAVIEAHGVTNVRPAFLATQLDLSVNEACAELCGLLAAVGKDATFRFENLDGVPVMVFDFPSNFAPRARACRQRDERRAWQRRMLMVTWRGFKIVVAFGLILSLVILCIAALAGMIAALVALSQQRGNRTQSLALRLQIQSMFYTLRQILWMYAVFGPEDRDGTGVTRELAYDTSLILSCCCGNPASIFYWFRAHQLSRRRGRIVRRWGRSVESEVEGVSLVSRGTWHEDDNESSPAERDEDKRLLSIAVEFLFGPEPAIQSQAREAWKMRLDLVTSKGDQGVRLRDFAPYLDNPPLSVDNESLVQEALSIVAHFNGVPSQADAQSPTNAAFRFPEVLAESPTLKRDSGPSLSDDPLSWDQFLFVSPSLPSSKSSRNDQIKYFVEKYYMFSTLTKENLVQCAALGAFNLIGVVWLKASLSKGGVLELPDNSIAWGVNRILVPILLWYACLFLLVPLARMCVFLILNKRRLRRNVLRRMLATQLQEAVQVEEPDIVVNFDS